MSCKACPPHMYPEDLMEQIEGQLALETELVSDSVYENRLTECASCPSLHEKTTCMHCGCFVQFRAKLSYKHCPHPEGSRWEEGDGL
ncbi:MAG: DUF6171 family protein [Bacillota bacterium]